MLNERLKNKALGSYLCLAAALVALVTAIVFLATQAAAAPLGHTGIMPGIVLLAGVAAAIVFFLVRSSITPPCTWWWSSSISCSRT